MDKDRVEGTARQVTGKIKEVAGRATDDPTTEAEAAPKRRPARCRRNTARPRTRSATRSGSEPPHRRPVPPRYRRRIMNVTDRIIRLKVDLAADRQTVWEALTGAQHVQAWWGRHVSLTPRAGGRLFVRGDGREQSREVRGRVLRWSPPSALELAWADAAWPAETRVNIRLTPTPDGDTLQPADEVPSRSSRALQERIRRKSQNSQI